MNVEHFKILVNTLFPENLANDEQIEKLGNSFFFQLEEKFKSNPEQLSKIINIDPLEASLKESDTLTHKGYNSVLCLHLFDFLEELQAEAHKQGIGIEQPKININIWDDFYDDGFIPEGEKQETYIYIEGAKDLGINVDQQNKILDFFLKSILDIHKNTNILKGVSFEMKLHDSKKEYPNLVGTEHEWCLYERWQIQVSDMTHKQLGDLITEIEKLDLNFEGRLLNIYSES